MAKHDPKPKKKVDISDAEELLLEFYSAVVEVPCYECFGKGWISQGRTTHVCGACMGSGAISVDF